MNLTEQICSMRNQKQFSIELIHNSKQDQDDIFYVCGLFMTKTIQPELITSFVIKYQKIIPYEHTYARLLKLHNAKEEDGFEMDKKIKIGLTCGFT